MAARVTDIDRGYRALVERVFEAAKTKPVVRVGIHESDGDRDDRGARVIDIATWNEFGTDRIPARSFVRAWFDGAEGQLREDLVTLMQSVVSGKRTREQILEILGQVAVGGMQARIAQHIDPPNAASTVKRKGSSTPLIDTGALRSSITYDVKEE